MLKIAVVRNDPHDIEKQFKALHERLKNAKYALGSILANQIKQDVVKRIPTGGSWLKLYRDSIDFYYDGEEWTVAGERDSGPIHNYDANTTLFAFTAADIPTRILTQYNDWPIDMIPALSKPYTSRVIVRAGASAAQVAVRRQMLTKQMPKILKALKQAGYEVKPFTLPTINGKLTADIKFMATRLEEGRGAYPFGAVPHWRPAAQNIESQVKTTMNRAKSKFEAILKGELDRKPKPMTSTLREALSYYKIEESP